MSGAVSGLRHHNARFIQIFKARDPFRGTYPNFSQVRKPQTFVAVGG